MFARMLGLTLGAILALVLTAQTNPDALVLHPDRWLASGTSHSAPQHHEDTSKR
jgi:hypothetical protein